MLNLQCKSSSTPRRWQQRPDTPHGAMVCEMGTLMTDASGGNDRQEFYVRFKGPTESM